jgi:hypothetical protein
VLAPEPLLDNRRHAAFAYHIWVEKGYAEALEYFKQHTTDGFGAHNPKKEMKRWGPRHDYKDNNDGRTGRRSELDPEDVRKCIHEFLHGYQVEGPGGMMYQVFYTSLQAAVVTERAPTIHKIIKEQELVSVQTLWRNMKKMEPKLVKCKRPMDVKAVLAPDVKVARMQVATKLSALDVAELDTVVWIDSKKIEIKPPGSKLKVYQPPGGVTVVEDERQSRGKPTAGINLNYYSGVCSLTGVVFFAYCTGTTAINKTPHRTVYKVVVSCSGMPINNCHAAVDRGWLGVTITSVVTCSFTFLLLAAIEQWSTAVRMYCSKLLTSFQCSLRMLHNCSLHSLTYCWSTCI